MKPPLHLPLLLALGLSACVSTSLPQFVIPETPGEFDATLSAAAITGLHLNCIYALDNTLVATCALHSGFSLYGELGFGAVTRNRKNLLPFYSFPSAAIFPRESAANTPPA